MLIISIDPGINGAICFFENGQVKEVIEMPTMAEGKKNKRQLNSALLVNLLKENISPLKSKNSNGLVLRLV